MSLVDITIFLIELKRFSDGKGLGLPVCYTDIVDNNRLIVLYRMLKLILIN